MTSTAFKSSFPIFNPQNLKQKAMPKARLQPSATISFRMYVLVVMAVRKDPQTWDTDFSVGLTDRGYTMHEHLDDFGLINMNGRVYDPLLGRFLSPDNHIQAPDNPQNYNRYAYALNNPLVYVDPDGEIIGTAVTFFGDLLKTAFFEGGLDPTSSSARQSAWRNFDPTAEWSPSNRAWRIDKGLLKTDENRTIAGRGLQLLSRFTWELPQTLFGNVVSHARNVTGNVTNVDYYGGATLVNRDAPGRAWGLTLGTYIQSKNVIADPYVDELFRHEYGHILQSRLTGPLYLSHVGIPSLISITIDRQLGWHQHQRSWFETQANRMAFRYFSNHEPNSLTFDPVTNRGRPWDNNRYPREYDPDWYWLFTHPPVPFFWWLFF